MSARQSSAVDPVPLTSKEEARYDALVKAAYTLTKPERMMLRKLSRKWRTWYYHPNRGR